MRKRKLILWLIVLLLALAFLFFFSRGDLTIAGHTTVVQAEMYVNGELLDMPAFIYWYGPTPETPLVQIPFFSTLEGLGCQIERDEDFPDSDATINVGNRQFFYQANTFDLYENNKIVLSGVSARPTFYGGNGIYGQLYIDDRNYRVLKALGFNQVTVEIDVRSRIVRLNAEIDGQ